MDYFAETLAEQAIASVGVPPELTQGLTGAALDAAKQKFKEELQAQIKQGLQTGLEEAQYALSESVSYVPDGVPVKPDPEGDYQMPQVTLRSHAIRKCRRAPTPARRARRILASAIS
jgi:hypothetical protein